MKYLTTIILFIFLFSGLTAQDKEINPCGTPPFKSEWLKKYQLNPKAFNTKNAEIIHVPFTVSLVGQNDGEGRMNESKLLDNLCTLQSDFNQTDIRFYLKEPIRNIDDSDFYVHEDVIAGGMKMHQYNVDGAINCYLVDDAASNCGYNLPWAGVAVQEACASPTDHTWAHEMGHALSVQHPFLGWEGGVGHDGSNPHDFSDPAPEFVTYNYTNFKDSIILDTVIIDTVMVEKLDGSNCHEAADGFCDTAPDYIAARWACTSDSVGFIQQTDPNGDKFYSDGTLIMSYSFSNCKGRFSQEQIAAMRANSLDEKGDISIVGMVITPPDNANEIQLMSPDIDELVYYRDVEFNWSEINEENYYLLQIGVEPSFSLILFDTIVSQPSMLLREADSTWGTLYWRVKPFTSDEFCTDFSASGTFEPTETSAVTFLEEDHLVIYPNILEDGQNEIFLKSDQSLDNMRFEIYNIQGKQVQTGVIHHNCINLYSSLQGAGMYIVSIESKSKPIVKKIYVR